MATIPFVFADRATVPAFLAKDVQMEVMDHLLRGKFVLDWLVSVGFPFAGTAVRPSTALELTEEDCKVFVSEVGKNTPEELEQLGYEVLEAGFANKVCATSCRDQALVVKRYTDLVFLRIEREAIGVVDEHAGRFGCGPRVFYSGVSGLVEERIPGRTLQEIDMHKGDFKLLSQVAKVLSDFHQLPIPAACEGEPMLWRTINKMMRVVQRRPDLMPHGMPSIDTILAEVDAARCALERHSPAIVLGHGDCKPSNVIASDDGIDPVKLIDFELGGPNYRGFDLMKLFRTAKGASKPCMLHFLDAYVERTKGSPPGHEELANLAAELDRFEPLTWLEAAIFFLTLPQFKADETNRWNDLAMDRWEKYMKTKGALV